MYSQLMLLILLLICPISVWAIQVDSPIQVRINQKVQSILGRTRYNGSVVVAIGDSILYERYNGLGNRRKRERVNTKTPFHIASISKTFTAMAIMKLQQDGLLNIYDPVSKYIVNFPYKNITIFHLLTHRSGIPKYTYFLRRRKNVFYKNADVLTYLARYKPRLRFTPNLRFTYCNTNYVILAYLISKVTNISYEQFLKKTFWDKHGFENTFVFNNKDKIPRYTPSYTHKKYPYFLNSFDYIYGDKNIYCTARDLVKWHKLLSDTSIFYPQTLELCYKPHSLIKKDIMKAYGLGWRMFYIDGYFQVVYHNGWWHGNKALFMRIVGKDVVVIAQTNTSSSVVYQMSKLLPLFVTPTKESIPTIDVEELKEELLHSPYE